MNICKGATYNIPIIIKIKGEPLALTNVSNVDFSFGGHFVKSYPPSNDKAVKHDEDKFVVHLSAEDTASLPQGVLHIQARITFNDGNVKFSHEDTLYVRDTEFRDSREVTVNAM